jgi:hypothetical protein
MNYFFTGEQATKLVVAEGRKVADSCTGPQRSEVPGENHRSVASYCQSLSHNVVSSTPRHERDSNSQLLVVIGTDRTDSCKSN